MGQNMYLGVQKNGAFIIKYIFSFTFNCQGFPTRGGVGGKGEWQGYSQRSWMVSRITIYVPI